MSTMHSIGFVVLLLTVIAFFPALDGMRMWRLAKHHRSETRQRMKHERQYWRRLFIWTVFSTKRVPRLTDQTDSRLNR